MDDQAVIREIHNRAGNPDIDGLAADLSEARARFFSLQRAAVSMLTTLVDEQRDTFLTDSLNRIKQLIAPEPGVVERSALPRGQVFSRDSRAMTQGLRAAPHQSAIALPLSAITLRNGIETLEQIAREAAAHIMRKEGRQRKPDMKGNAVFIGHGHSQIWRELKDFLQDRLKLAAVEFNSTSVAGIATSARLSELLDAAKFAFLIMTGEDEHQGGKMRARENVVHEVGLFQGRLGFKRAVVMLEEGCEEFSNIHGLGQIRFPKGNISAKFEEIRAVLEREGLT